MGWTLDFLRERLLGWIQDQGGWVRPLTPPHSPTPLGPLGLSVPTIGVPPSPFWGHMSDQPLIHRVPNDLSMTLDLLMTPDPMPRCPPWCLPPIPLESLKFYDNPLTSPLVGPCPYLCPLTPPCSLMCWPRGCPLAESMKCLLSLSPGRPPLLLWDTHMADSDHLCGWSAHRLAHHLEEDGLRPSTALDFFCINYGIFQGGGADLGAMGVFLTFLIIGVGQGKEAWSWGVGTINLFRTTLWSLSHWARFLAVAGDQASCADPSFSEGNQCPLWVSGELNCGSALKEPTVLRGTEAA